MSHLLNNGEIPNLFPAEEKQKIIEDVILPKDLQMEKFAYFLASCKSNLHMIICMQPVGEVFRRRLRNFPAIV